MGAQRAPVRSACAWCGKPMVPLLLTEDGLRWSRSASLANMDRDGYFCTLRCAARFGVSAVSTPTTPPRAEK